MIGLVHTDLKPDNIMFVNRHEQPLRVKLIDFGLPRAVADIKPSACVQATWYRAPEVMLHIPFNESIDMWCLGLVVAELATGFPFYPRKMEYDVQRRWMFKTSEEFANEMRYHAVETRSLNLKNLDNLQELMSKERHQNEQQLLMDLIKKDAALRC